jgi:hypothetical protein
MTSTELIERIERIIAKQPFRAEAISGVTGVALQRDPVTSNEYFTIYTGSGGGFGEVEVREPTAASAGKTGIVLLSLEPPCLSREAFGERFGPIKPGPPSPPSHGGIADGPRYELHPQEWGEVRLGYADECVVRVVLDGT